MILTLQIAAVKASEQNDWLPVRDDLLAATVKPKAEEGSPARQGSSPLKSASDNPEKPRVKKLAALKLGWVEGQYVLLNGDKVEKLCDGEHLLIDQYDITVKFEPMKMVSGSDKQRIDRFTLDNPKIANVQPLVPSQKSQRQEVCPISSLQSGTFIGNLRSEPREETFYLPEQDERVCNNLGNLGVKGAAGAGDSDQLAFLDSSVNLSSPQRIQIGSRNDSGVGAMRQQKESVGSPLSKQDGIGDRGGNILAELGFLEE